MNPDTIDQFKRALPAKCKGMMTPELTKEISEVLADPDMYESYRENFLSYAHVLEDGKFKTTSYLYAIKYVSHKLAGLTNGDSFAKTFPDKVQRWITDGVAAKDIASYVSAYHKSKLVTLIMKQTLTPSWILNQDLYQKALNTQAELMISARSEKVRSDAANSILTHLKMPETAKVELDIAVKKDSSIDQLREATVALAKQQRDMLAAGGMTAKEVAHSNVVIEGEVSNG